MQVGENHNNTKESSEYLKSLTQQAVILQKAINQIYSNTPGACIPPPKVCTVWMLCEHTQMHAFLVVTVCFSLVFHTEPSHNTPAAQPDMWNHSHPPQVITETDTGSKVATNVPV